VRSCICFFYQQAMSVIWCTNSLGCMAGLTLLLICVSAAGLLVVIQWERREWEGRGPRINQDPHQIQKKTSIKKAWVLVVVFFVFLSAVSSEFLLVLETTGNCVALDGRLSACEEFEDSEQWGWYIGCKGVRCPPIFSISSYSVNSGLTEWTKAVLSRIEINLYISLYWVSQKRVLMLSHLFWVVPDKGPLDDCRRVSNDGECIHSGIVYVGMAEGTSDRNFTFEAPKPVGRLRSFTRRSRYRPVSGLKSSKDQLGSNSSLSSLSGSLEFVLYCL